MNPELLEPICQEIAWKSGEFQRFAVSLVKRAYAQGGQFTTDLVPDSDRGDGQGIAGTVVESLKNANLIKPVGIQADGQWYPLLVPSKRPGSKSRYIRVYQLASPALALAFLKRHGALAEPPVQTEFFPAQSPEPKAHSLLSV